MPDRRPPLYISLWYALAVLALIVTFQNFYATRQSTEIIPYSQFETSLKSGEIADVTLSDHTIEGTYKKSGANGKPQHFITERVAPDIARELTDAKVTFQQEAPPGLFEKVFTWMLPILAMVALWLFLSRQMVNNTGAGGMMAIGKSKARIFMERAISTTFADVAGVDEAKEELKEIIAFLKDPQGYGRLGAHVPKGVLLVGPPGTGKTLLARAVAGEAGVPFFSISGSEFVELFVGVGAARVRDLFEQARAHAPCIIFIDELDALGRARGAMPVSGGQDEKEQTLNQLLTELDGFDASSGVVLLAATNRPEILDPALLRAGRFDRQILVDRPDKAGRLAILGVHTRKVKLDPNVSLETVAALTTGFTGADLANLVNEAALLATRRNAMWIENRDLTEAIERVIAGLEKKSRVLNAQERRTVAYHELGHALVALALPGADRVQKVSIIPRGVAALGYTIQRPTEDRFLMSRTELADKMAVLLGGRAAEALVLGDISTGAADDLAKATAIARSMVLAYGMVPELGQVSYENEAPSLLGTRSDEWLRRTYSEQTAATIDKAVRELVDAAFVRARAILAAERGVLEQAAVALLKEETLSGEWLQGLLNTKVTEAAA
ncbi:MAG TPA: ATP-dependent zinc metalloprotease FtsH [Dyella sp.]|uniref:ATP-dependent zinc metalloprotease FtsH n=1 Tax=Dyella sp. TaxID=1869338 RepID=UPI002C8DE3FA|nr:ATP-dependent zinc metalloprotease FtsH [Dyella sp.]HUB88111.1 ATP-dependent zinc metalloprotease FtsH [Dyella sp.]